MKQTQNWDHKHGQWSTMVMLCLCAQGQKQVWKMKTTWWSIVIKIYFTASSTYPDGINGGSSYPATFPPHPIPGAGVHSTNEGLLPPHTHTTMMDAANHKSENTDH